MLHVAYVLDGVWSDGFCLYVCVCVCFSKRDLKEPEIT